MNDEKARIRHSLSLIHGAISDILGLQKGKKSDLSPVAISILYNASTKKLQVGDITRIYDIKKSTASGYVDNLEKKGYVKRMKSEDDRRNTYIVPTEKGKKWILAKENKLAVYIEKRMKRLKPEEQERFVELLERFVEG
jgi:DNA-binding MarR family transcriptional regulator